MNAGILRADYPSQLANPERARSFNLWEVGWRDRKIKEREQQIETFCRRGGVLDTARGVVQTHTSVRHKVDPGMTPGIPYLRIKYLVYWAKKNKNKLFSHSKL